MVIPFADELLPLDSQLSGSFVVIDKSSRIVKKIL